MFKMKLISLLFLATIVNASNPLTLNEALNILITDNLEIQSATLDVNSAKSDIEIVNGTHWGKLEFIQDVANSNDAGNVFGFRLTSREVTPKDLGVQALNYPDLRNYFQSKLKYEVPLFTGFKISSYEKVMSSMMKMKSLEKDQVVNEKNYQLRKSYYDMALLQNSVKNLNKILKNIETLKKMTTKMLEVGYVKKVDLLEVQAKKGNIQRLLLQMQSNQKLLYHYISFLLNQKITKIIVPNADVPMPSYSNKEVSQKNLDIQRAKTGLKIKKSMLDSSKSSYYPTIGAYAELATTDDTFLGDANEHKAYTIGARLTWNIFNGGSDNAKVEKSQLQYLKTKTELNLAKQGIALKVARIRTEIQTFDAEIASLNKELLLSNEIYKNYAGRYREKLSSMSDVIIKQSEQIQKILQLQTAKNKRNERIFALEKLANGEQI